MIDEKKLIEILDKNSIFKSITNAEGKNIYEIIEEQPKMENTVEFKHFLLSADSTLKSWGKEALLEYIHTLYHNWKNTDCDYNRTIDFANELLDEIERLQSQLVECQRVCKQKQERLDELEKQYMAQFSKEIEKERENNPALKFDELYVGMWVWDSAYEMYLHIEDIKGDMIYPCEDYFCDPCDVCHNMCFKFEENRFYRVER